MIQRFNFLTLIFIAILVVFTYWNLPNTFFQQDEWETLADSIYHQSKGTLGIIQSSFPPDAMSHFNPLARIYSWFTYLFFYTNFTPHAWLSIGLHTLNVFLLYYFVYVWLNNRRVAFIAGLFFGVNSIPHQAITWVAATNSYEIPMLLILASLLFFQKFLIQKDNRKRNIILSLSAFFVSLLFHENGIFLFLFYPTMFFFIARSEWKKLLPTFSYGMLFCIFAFVFIRIPFFFGLNMSFPDMTDFSRPPISVYPYRFLSIALKSFAGSLIPEKTLIDISDKVVNFAYPQFLTPDKIPNPFIAQSIIFDFVSYVLTILIVCALLLFTKVIREKKVLKAFIWALIFVPVSLSPYIFVLGKAGYASIIESKFFYIGSIGVSILVGIIAYSILLKFSGQKTLKVIVYFLFGLYLLSHVHAIRAYIDNLAEISTQRKMFLTKIQSSYPNLPDKVIFFTESDTAYYGMPSDEKILPLQFGFGRMLMLWYQKEEKLPGCLYNEKFLSGLLTEGYKECDGRGFGYFRDYDKLVRIVRANNIKPEEIIAYSWERQREKFTDVTQSLRNKIGEGFERN